MIFDSVAALELAALNEAGYLLATTGHCALPAGFSAPIPVRMPAGVTRPFLLRNDPLDIWAYATSRDGVLYLVFRGTQITSGIQFFQEWAEDALSLPLVACGPGHVHRGFYDAWIPLRAPVVEMVSLLRAVTTRLVITGHSLGAAIATLCWAELRGDLLTFNCPRVGDPAFAKALWDGQTVRVINEGDIVSDLPPDPPFRHGGFEQLVHGPHQWDDPLVAHRLESDAIGLQAVAKTA